MKYCEYKAQKKFQDIICKYWMFEVLDNLNLSFPLHHNTLPENKVSIVLISQPYYTGVRLLGPHLKNYNQQLYPNSTFFGIKFQPWITIIPDIENKTEIVNTTCEASMTINNTFKAILPDLAKRGFKDLKHVETCIATLIDKTKLLKNDMVKYICLELDNNKTISEVIEKIPASTRVIQKKFKAVTGITMKQYASINRQRTTWKAILLNNQNELDAILDNGFFDQSHFINEFKMIMKRSHKEFKAYLNTVEIEIH